MKLLHISDLHIGKRLYGYSLLEDQAFMLHEITRMAREEKADALLICGDVYDRAVPSEEAVSLLDEFLTTLLHTHIAVYLIAGNHDSAERLQFGSRILQQSGLHIAGALAGPPKQAVLSDTYGEVMFTMLPYISVTAARVFLKGEIRTSEDAVRAALAAAPVHAGARNVLLAHQFVTAGREIPWRCESETAVISPGGNEEDDVSVGGLDRVDAGVFEGYDYVALGHLHGAQAVGKEHIRYAGSPLQYSFDQKEGRKSVTVIELGGKGEVSVSLLPIKPLREMLSLRGTMESLLQQAGSHAYVECILTDAYEVPDAMARLRAIFPNIMHIRYDNARTRAAMEPLELTQLQELSIPEHFAAFYEKQNGSELSGEAEALLLQVIQAASEEEAWQ